MEYSEPGSDSATGETSRVGALQGTRGQSCASRFFFSNPQLLAVLTSPVMGGAHVPGSLARSG